MQLAGKCHRKDIVWLLPNLNLMKSRAKNVLVITFQDLGAAIVLDLFFLQVSGNRAFHPLLPVILSVDLWWVSQDTLVRNRLPPVKRRTFVLSG